MVLPHYSIYRNNTEINCTFYCQLKAMFNQKFQVRDHLHCKITEGTTDDLRCQGNRSI
jgi:hypothetical protein